VAYAPSRQSYGNRSYAMKSDRGKTFYRHTRTAGAGSAAHRKRSKTTTRRRRRTNTVMKLFKMIVSKKRGRR